MEQIRIEDIEIIIKRMPYKFCENKVFLITGATGFIASYLVDTLMYLNKNVLQEKCTVIALCRSKEKAEQRFGQWLLNETFILQIQSVEDQIAEVMHIDYIIHAASCSATKDFCKIPVKVLAANILGTYNLLEYARKNRVDSFLFISSGAVYGNIEGYKYDIKETDTFALDFCATHNSYAEGKRGGEAFCCAYYAQYEVPAKIVRLGHTYGPGIDINDGHVYSDFVRNITSGTDLIVNNGGARRSFCYVADAVVAIFQILFLGGNGEIYNMENTEETYSIFELASKLVKEAFPERNLKVICNGDIEQAKQPKVNIEKLKKLGWHSDIDVVNGFRRTVRSFEEKNV